MMQETLTKHLKEALDELGLGSVPFTLEHPGNLAHGDYATNAALAAAREMRESESPRAIAARLAALLEARGIKELEKIEVAGPGFINFHLSREFLAGALEEAAKRGEAWGRGKALAGKKVLIEYTSPNLFKPLHIGNLVGNILGESISRLLEGAGARVVRLNYPSDIGLTVAKGVWGLWKNKLNPDDINDLGRAYIAGNAAYEDGSAKTEIEDINRALYSGGNPEWSELRRRGVETSRKHLDALCETLGTTFDREFFESESGPVGAKIVETKTGAIFEKSDGAIVYRGERDGLHTRVFLTTQGLPTYEAKDLGLLSLKVKAYPDFDITITDTGPEQKDYFKVLYAVARKVFPELREKTLVHTTHGYLRLTSGKMSSRLGNVITGESLLDELTAEVKEKMRDREIAKADVAATQIAVAALKYAVLRQRSGRDIVFDPEESLTLEGDSGPYLQYAHTRALSVLGKAGAMKLSAQKMPPQSFEVERLLHRFPEVVERAAREYEPHYVTSYLTELAGTFNAFYAAERIIDDKEHGPYKLLLTKAFATTMKNGLWLLGISAPEKM